jgi:hypothetical protein
MSPVESVASDPSVADYRATSPYEWGGVPSYSRSLACRTNESISASLVSWPGGTQRVA